MRFVPNPNFSKEIERQVEYHAGLMRYAEEVLAQAILIAQGFAKTGDYLRSLSILVQGITIYVRTKDFAGHMVEFGSVNNPAYAVIRRAVMASGLRLDEAQRNRIGQPSFNAVIPDVG